MLDRKITASPALSARVAGAFYLITVVASLYEHFYAGGSSFGQVARLLSGASYLTVIWLLYELMRPVGKDLSLLAAFFGIVGVAKSDNSIAYFGIYSALIGFLIWRSTFLPRILGVLMMLAGLGLLINAYGPLLWPSLPKAASAIGFSLDGVGEIGLTLWLIVMGVNQDRWRAQANGA